MGTEEITREYRYPATPGQVGDLHRGNVHQTPCEQTRAIDDRGYPSRENIGRDFRRDRVFPQGVFVEVKAGRQTSTTVGEAIVHQVMEKALNGDHRSMKLYFELVRQMDIGAEHMSYEERLRLLEEEPSD